MYGMGVFEGISHAVVCCTNAARGLSTTAGFLAIYTYLYVAECRPQMLNVKEADNKDDTSGTNNAYAPHSTAPLISASSEHQSASSASNEHMSPHRVKRRRHCQNNRQQVAVAATDDGRPAYFCGICECRFTQAESLKSHMCIHSDERIFLTSDWQFSCRICRRKYHRIGNLQTHMLTHTNPIHSCHLCGRQFSCIGGLKTHSRVHSGVHSGERPFVCDLCHGSFTKLKTLRSHMLRTCVPQFAAASQSDDTVVVVML